MAKQNAYFGGRFTLIANVSQSMPVYILSAINTPRGMINRLHSLMANVFLLWGGGVTWDI